MAPSSAHLPRRTLRRLGPLALAIALAGAALGLAGIGTGLAVPRTAAPGGGTVLQVSATTSFTFVPSQLTVTAGEPVELEVTQEANFNHTFTLSSVAGYTFPSSATASDIFAYFAAHPPLVNLSLGDVPGRTTYANFTAPPAGAYEFLCEIPGHFQSGMFGTLTSTATPSPSSPPPPPPTYLYVGIGVAIAAVAVAVAGVVLYSRRRPKPAPPPAA